MAAGNSVNFWDPSGLNSGVYKGIGVSYPGLRLQVNFYILSIIPIEEIEGFINIIK